MLATFRETWTSLGDFKYGNTIVGKTAGQAMWYWTKYLLLFAGLLVILSLGLLVYYVPQIPSLADKNFPDIEVSIKNGQVSTTASEPYVIGDSNFSFVINTHGTGDDLKNIKSGAILLKDKIVVKSEDGQSRTQDLSDIKDLTLNKKTVVDWAVQSKPTLLFMGLVALLVFLTLMSGFYWLWKMLSIIALSLVFWIVATILKRTASYVDILKLALYASVLPLFISAFSLFAPNPSSSLISLILLALYTLAWIYHLPIKEN